MNELQRVFDYQGSQVRTIVKNGEPWFVAKDVCNILDISDARKAVQRLDEDERSLIPVTDSLGRPQETFIVNEAGLYALILGSRKNEAKQFKRWITHEVIPTIRKTGGYVADEDRFISTYLPFADEATQMLFKSTLRVIQQQNEQIAAMRPKAEYFDALVERNLLTNFRDTAKELHVGQKKFIDFLLEKKYVYRDAKGKLKPYMQYVPELFQLKEWERNGKADVQTLITPKGRETFRFLIKALA